MTTATLTPERVLKATDRCDRCGAQAFFRATIVDDLPLFFCGHHGRWHNAKLQEVAVDILDESRFINE